MTSRRPALSVPLSRRRLLGGLAAATSASLFASCADAEECPDGGRATGQRVVVVGAGVAGLTAARSLAMAGRDVVVVEARDRVGGRVHSVDFDGTPLDLGAAWVHGTRGNPLTALASSLGIELRSDPQPLRRWWDARVASSLTDAEIAEVEDEADAFVAALRRVRRRVGAGASYQDGVDWWVSDLGDAKRRRVRHLLGIYNELDYGGPCAQTSLDAFWEEEEFGGGDHLPIGGYAPIIEYLAEGLDLRLSTPVSAVTRVGAEVRVETATETFVADAVIVTVPLGVLRANAIRFDPPLAAAKQRAIQRLDMGSLEKVALRFDDRFWSSSLPAAGVWIHEAASGSDFPYGQDFSDAVGAPTLVCFNGGAASRALQDALSDDELVSRALQSLDATFGMSVPTPQATRVTRWRSDPWSRGSYSYIPVGASFDDICALGAPDWDNHLLFAGEATERSYYQTVHGALLSGAREARRFGVPSAVPGA
ncbi:MAG: FAD-dependent oxidoreductase [Myxococcales bacterium]|nr:FAD-dependent oxidoreductase [Myxococcales bacterium]MCB9534507.1 FAD-dependent oxidoreductase [Myxococcales bacterium]